MDDPLFLNEAILEDGLQTTNFFNGRLLSAEDLQTEQEAGEYRDQRLAQALGAGVVWGLEVRHDGQPDTLVTVQSGLALNRRGQALELPETVTIDIRPKPGQVQGGSGRFSDCSDVSASLAPSASHAVFLLCMIPARGSRARAPTSGLEGGSSCTAKYRVEGVSFRLVRLAEFDAYPYANEAELKRLRNRVAFRCFGYGDNGSDLRFHLQNPFAAAPPDYGLLDRLYGGSDPELSLSLCDVPLAVVYWQRSAGIRFVDLWSVRRRPQRYPLSRQWFPLLGERRFAEGEAMFCQFSDQLRELLDTGSNLASLEASAFLDYLPGAGLLPIGPQRFRHESFFAGTSFERGTLPEARLRQVLHEGLLLEPIQVGAWPEAIRILELSNSTQYVLFMRDDRKALVIPPPDMPPTNVPPAEPTPLRQGQFVIELKRSIFRTLERPISTVEVWAEDEKNTIYPAQATLWANRINPQNGIRLSRESRNGEYARSSIRNFAHSTSEYISRDLIASTSTPLLVAGRHVVFTISSLPPGKYRIKAKAQGYHVASYEQSLAPGERKSLDIFLEPLGVMPDLPNIFFFPDYELPDPWGRYYKKLVVPELGKVLPKVPLESWGNPRPIDPPREWQGLLEDVVQTYLNRHPQAPITVDNVKLLIRPDYNPDRVSDEPYAYLLTSNGAGLPVILTPSDQTLPGEVLVSQTGIPELSAERVSLRLGASALVQMDLFAGAWSGLVAEMLGTSLTSAHSLIAESRSSLKDMKGSLTYYAGLSTEAAQRLKEKNYSDFILANATAASLLETLNPGSEGRYTIHYAQRLIEQARTFVPAQAWSLSNPEVDLAFNDMQLNTLKALKIDSVGALERALSDPELQPRLQLFFDDLPQLQETVVNHSQQMRDVFVQKRAISSLESLKAFEDKLSEAGLADLSEVANALPTDVAQILAISEEEATTVINEALVEMLVSKTAHTGAGTLDRDTIQDIVSKTRTLRLSDLSDERRLTAAGADATTAVTLSAIAQLSHRGGLR